MNRNQQRKLWQIAAGGAAILAGMATRKAIQQGWRYAKKCEPPNNPDAKDVTWTDAIIWTALSGAAVGVSRMLITRSASLSLNKFSSLEPPEEDIPGVED